MGPSASSRSKWTTCFCVSPLKITQTCWLGSAEKLPPIMMIQLPCIHRCVSIGWAEGRLCLLDSSEHSAELLTVPQSCLFYFNLTSIQKDACLKISKTPKTYDFCFVFLERCRVAAQIAWLCVRWVGQTAPARASTSLWHFDPSSCQTGATVQRWSDPAAFSLTCPVWLA